MSQRASEVVRSLVERLTATTGRALHAFDRAPPIGEDFLRRLLRNLPGMAYRCANDPEWTMEYVSHGCRALTGFDPQDLVNNQVVSYAALIHPDDQDEVRDAVRQAILAGEPYRITYRLRRADGKERLVWEQGGAVVGYDGRVEALEGFITDVTEQSELSARISEQEAQFRALVEQSLAGVYIIRDGRFVYVNQRYADIYRYTVDEILALDSFGQLIHPDDRDLVSANIRRRLSGEVDEVHYELRVVRKDGEQRVVETHGRRIELGGAPAVMGMQLDVTERRRQQLRYHEGQKLEALGRLASGVAHDLNNFLSLVKVTAQIVMNERERDARLVADLDEIVSAVDRGTRLSRQLMHFGRPQSEAPSATSFEEVIEGLRPMLSRVVGKDIELRLDIEPDLPHVFLAAAQAEEIVMNLVMNGGDAMPHGGSLTVRVETAEGMEGATDARKDRHVVLSVSDTGFGIAEGARKHLFEPYYTTKGDAGTGLGLANVWRIATDVGGFVDVESELGSGSTFKVLLPLATQDDAP